MNGLQRKADGRSQYVAKRCDNKMRRSKWQMAAARTSIEDALFGIFTSRNNADAIHQVERTATSGKLRRKSRLGGGAIAA